MLTERTAHAESPKSLVVTLLQQTDSSLQIFAVKLREGDSKTSVKAFFNNRTFLIPELPASPRESRQHAWRLMQTFVEHGAQGICSLFQDPQAAPGCSSLEEAALPGGSLVTLRETSEQVSLTVRHGGSSPDTLIFRIPLREDSDLLLTLARRFFRGLADGNFSSGLLSDLQEFLLIHGGESVFHAGSRYGAAEKLHRSLSRSLAEQLEFWEKHPGPRDAAELEGFLRGLEFETIRKCLGCAHLFPEMRLALPNRWEAEDPGYFILRKEPGFALKFRLPKPKNAQVWQRSLNSLVQTFARSPETVVHLYSDRIDPSSAAPFPITPENLSAFQHVVRLYRANQKVLARKLKEVGEVCSDFRYIRGTFYVRFDRHAGLFSRSIEYKVCPKGCVQVSLKGKAGFFRNWTKLPLGERGLKEKELDRIFSLFYSKEPEALERDKVRESALYRYIAAQTQRAALHG